MNAAERYFDNASTTPIDRRVVEAMLPWLNSEFGNASSIHSLGLAARAAVEVARLQVAHAIGAEPEQIVFTSSATESNNWVLNGFDRVSVSPFEHSSVREAAQARNAQSLAWENDRLWMAGDADLVSVIGVESETGTFHSPPETSSMVHRDLTQAVGKVPFDLGGVAFGSLSAHKIHGPKGVGALYAAGDWPDPLLHGGGQESGRRAGTLNVPGIVGFGLAAQIAEDEFERNLEVVRKYREAFLDVIQGSEGLAILSPESGSPYILSIAFDGLTGEALVLAADSEGFQISAGPACSSGSSEPSPVLLAYGWSTAQAQSAIRISFSKYNTADLAAELARCLARNSAVLRKLR